MNLSFEPALAYRFLELAEYLNHSFSGYLVDVKVNAPALAQLARYESVDLTASRLIMRDDEVIGCALIARRGWTSRLAAMGIMPEGRQQGIGRWTMAQLIAEAKDRAEQAMVLEVIEQNRPAVQLYQQAGFQAIRRLVGYNATDPDGIPNNQLQEIAIPTVAQMLMTHGVPDLPWQLSGPTLVQTTPPNRAYRLGPAYITLSDPAQEQIAIRSIVVEQNHQRQGWATRLLHAVIAAHSGKIWKASIVYPEEIIGRLFEKLGFEQEKLSQLQMRIDLTE